MQELGIQLPTPPEPFGIYAEAVQTGNCFLDGNASHCRPRSDSSGASVRNSIWKQARSGSAGDAQCPRCREAASGIARQSDAGCPAWRAVATSGDVREQPRVADGASELMQEVFGKDKNLADWCTG